MEKSERKRGWINATIIGLLLFSTLVSFVYAFVQQGIAEENERIAIESTLNCQKAAENYEKELSSNKAQLERAKQAVIEFEKLLESKKKSR